MNSELREAMKYTLTARGRCAETGEYHVAYDIDETIDGLMVIIDRYAAQARIDEASWWTRNYRDPDYEPLLSERLNRLKKHRKVQGDSNVQPSK